MAQADTAWSVLDHGPLEQLAENLWWVVGSVPRMPIKRNMVIVRRTDGTLLIHNAMALREAAQLEVEALGKPAILLVPNGFHRLDCARYKARYADLKVYAPSGSRARVAQVVAVDGTYGDVPADDHYRIEPIAGVKHVEGVLVVKSKDGSTVVVNDCVFNMDPPPRALQRFLMRVMNNTGGPRVSRIGKALLVKDRPTFRAELERYAALPDLQRFIVAHDKCVHGPEAASAALRTAAHSL